MEKIVNFCIQLSPLKPPPPCNGPHTFMNFFCGFLLKFVCNFFCVLHGSTSRELFLNLKKIVNFCIQHLWTFFAASFWSLFVISFVYCMDLPPVEPEALYPSKNSCYYFLVKPFINPRCVFSFWLPVCLSVFLSAFLSTNICIFLSVLFLTVIKEKGGWGVLWRRSKVWIKESLEGCGVQYSTVHGKFLKLTNETKEYLIRKLHKRNCTMIFLLWNVAYI